MFFLSVCNTIHLGSFLLPRSSACAESTALTPGLAHMDFLPSLRSYHRPELAASLLDFLHLGLMMSARRYVSVGFPLSALRAARSESSPSVPNCAHPGLSAPLRSLAYAGSACSILRFTDSGSSLSLRSMARADAAISATGLSRAGLVFSLPVLDFLHPEPPLLLQSMARPDVLVSALDFMGADSAVSAQGSGELAPFLLRRVQPAWAQYSCCQPSTRAVWGPLCYRKATAKSISRYPCRTTCMQARLHHQELCGWGHAFLPHANQDLTCNYPFRTM